VRRSRFLDFCERWGWEACAKRPERWLIAGTPATPAGQRARPNLRRPYHSALHVRQSGRARRHQEIEMTEQGDKDRWTPSR